MEFYILHINQPFYRDCITLYLFFFSLELYAHSLQESITPFYITYVPKPMENVQVCVTWSCDSLVYGGSTKWLLSYQVRETEIKLPIILSIRQIHLFV